MPGGIGWYRKHFTIDAKDKYERYFIGFDGVYMNSTVYINGHQLGTRPYGYSSFEYDLTPYINKKGDNVIAVRVNNSDQPNSRWYSGCGIYRHVWLTKTHPVRISQWGQYVSSSSDGTVRVRVDWEDCKAVSAAGKKVSAKASSLILNSVIPSMMPQARWWRVR